VVGIAGEGGDKRATAGYYPVSNLPSPQLHKQSQALMGQMGLQCIGTTNQEPCNIEFLEGVLPTQLHRPRPFATTQLGEMHNSWRQLERLQGGW
jgi:hypothetical protein